MARAVARNGLPKIIRILVSSRISNITKLIGRMNLSTLMSTFFAIPRGYWMDLSASSKLILVGLGSPSPSFSYIEYGIRLMLVPKSAKALSMCNSPISQGMVKPPGSFSLNGSLFNKTIEHHSFIVTVHASSKFVLFKRSGSCGISTGGVGSQLWGIGGLFVAS
ncbi:hypothetical protein Tco_1490310 [Tanacetum coccineum]